MDKFLPVLIYSIREEKKKSIDPLLTNLNMELRGILTTNKINLKEIAFADDLILGIKNKIDLDDFWFIFNKYCLNNLFEKVKGHKINCLVPKKRRIRIFLS